MYIPYCHHERWDGTGYPRGLKGEPIPLAARIFAVADVWDALSSDRPYRKAWPRAKVVKHIKQDAGSHFDPTIVRGFMEMLAEKSATSQQPHTAVISPRKARSASPPRRRKP